MVFKVKNRRLMVCDCEKTMELDGKKLKACLGGEGELLVYSNLCRTQIEAFSNAAEDDSPLMVACTQEAPLFRKETDSYKFNLEGREPALYIVFSDEDDDEDDRPLGVHMVTACPYEAADYLDSGEQIVEPVAMPPEVFALVSDFIDEHHVEEKFKKRKRSEVKQEDHKFGQEPIAEMRKRMRLES